MLIIVIVSVAVAVGFGAGYVLGTLAHMLHLKELEAEMELRLKSGQVVHVRNETELDDVRRSDTMREIIIALAKLREETDRKRAN